MCISAFGPSSLLPCCLSIRLFCYVLLVAIFYSDIVWFLLHPVVRMFWCNLPQLVDRISFRCFGVSRFVCFILPSLDIFLIFLLSPVLSGLFPQVVLLFFLVLLFLFSYYMFHRFSFILLLLPVFVDFLLAFLVKFPIQVLIFFFVLFKGTPIFSQTNFAPA